MNLQQLKIALEKLGVQKGVSLMVSSDIIRVWCMFREAGNEFHPTMLINLLQDLITEEGTLVFPTYNWDFCKGKSFDYNKTRCKTGAIGQVALGLPEFSRTKHPIYSFAVWGKDKETLVAMNNKKSFGKDSPFSFFVNQGYKNLIIDVSIKNSFTFVHYVESCLNVSYRYEKEFIAPYIDANGMEETKSYSMFVRKLELDVYAPEQIDAFVADEIVESTENIGEILLQVIEFNKAYQEIESDILDNKGRNIVSYIGQ